MPLFALFLASVPLRTLALLLGQPHIHIRTLESLDLQPVLDALAEALDPTVLPAERI